MDASAKTESKKVILIDDDLLIRDCMMLFLTDKGFQLTSCQTFDEALDALKGGHYDLLLCDQCILKDQGAGTFDLIKDYAPETVRVVFTGPTGLDSSMDVAMNGIDAIVTKPFSATTINEILHMGLREK
jgi:DNA-binding NtrC family response regulator